MNTGLGARFPLAVAGRAPRIGDRANAAPPPRQRAAKAAPTNRHSPWSGPEPSDRVERGPYRSSSVPNPPTTEAGHSRDGRYHDRRLREQLEDLQSALVPWAVGVFDALHLDGPKGASKGL